MRTENLIFLFALVLVSSCSVSKKPVTTRRSTPPEGTIRSEVVIRKDVPPATINTGAVKPADVVAFAKQQLGVPYLYGGMDRKKGFDCSGFINYVFNHFKIAVPRISYQFTNAGVDIPVEFSKPGDLILFTGSDAHSGIVGHMGIVTENVKGQIQFIHASTSRGVIISGMNAYFIPRYVKVNRIFIP